MPVSSSYPLRLEGELDAPLKRWLRLVKWLLVLPHVIVLAFLWIGFVAAWVVALVSILVTGRYPRPLFDFNVGVLRWSWRVGFYAYSAIGTDRVSAVHARGRPRLPRAPAGRVPAVPLTGPRARWKWWLLALPHYVVVSIFAGGAWAGWNATSDSGMWTSGGGLIGLMVLVAGVVLLFTGRYPQAIFDFVMGMNRWVYRVGAYAALMTDAYPPFRLDMGAHEATSETLPADPLPPRPAAAGLS